MALAAFNCKNCSKKSFCTEKPDDDFKMLTGELRMTHICFSKAPMKAPVAPKPPEPKKAPEPPKPPPFSFGQETSIRRMMTEL